MKKFTAMLLTLCFSVAIVGCGEETKTTTKSKTDASGTKTTSSTTTEKK